MEEYQITCQLSRRWLLRDEEPRGEELSEIYRGKVRAKALENIFRESVHEGERTVSQDIVGRLAETSSEAIERLNIMCKQCARLSGPSALTSSPLLHWPFGDSVDRC